MSAPPERSQDPIWYFVFSIFVSMFVELKVETLVSSTIHHSSDPDANERSLSLSV